VKGQPRPKDCTQNHLLQGHLHGRHSQRRFYFNGVVFQRFADFLSQNFAQPLHITPEAHTVFLNVYVAQLPDEPVADVVVFA